MRPTSMYSHPATRVLLALAVFAWGTTRAGDFLGLGENLAEFGVANQSSQLGGYSPDLALDGNFGNFTHTQATADLPGPAWWEVDLLDEVEIGLIVICNRTSCCGSRLRDIVVEIRDEGGEIVWATTDVEDPDPDALLNPENEQGTFPLGPASVFVDVLGLNGGSPVSGQFIRVNRLPDEDLSGTGGQGNADEGTVLSIGEFGAFEDGLDCPDEGDSHCLSVEAEGPAGDLPGLWTFTVTGDDDSGDLLSVRVSAEHSGGTVVRGSSDTDQVVLDLPESGTWTITASVDDSAACADEADDATCAPLELEVEAFTCVEAVQDIACELTAVGLGQGALVSWTTPPDCLCEEIEIQVDGVTVQTVPGNATSAQINPGNLPDGSFVVTVLNCSGFGTSCSVFNTDDQGQILTQAFLALGPISNGFGCSGNDSDLLGNHIAPSFIGCEYPEEGEETQSGVDLNDPNNVSFGFHPAVEPVWRRFLDATPADGDQNLNEDIAGALDDHMTWLATYVEYTGDGGDFQLCVGSDDGVQVWLNDRLLHNNNACRGRGACQDLVPFSLDGPGVFCLRIGAWNRGGGWGCSIGLQDELGLPIIDGIDPEWIFHGIEKPADAEFPPCVDIDPVQNLSCAFDDEGGIEVSWDNPGGGGDIMVTVQGEVIETLGPNAEGVVIDVGDLPAEDPLRVCVDNGANIPACCSLSNNVALGKPAAQSSQLGAFDPGRAVDGNFGNFHHTNNTQAGPAVWEVDLEEDFDITRIVIHNRGDGCCQSRLRDLVVSIHDGSFLDDFIDPEIEDNAEEWVPDPLWEEHSVNLIWQTDEVLNPENLDGSPATIEIDLAGEGDGAGVIGRYVRVTRISDADQSGGAGNADEPKVLQMGEVEVFGRLPGAGPEPMASLKPGDVNSDGSFNIADAVAHLGFLFGGEQLAACFTLAGGTELSPAGLAMLDFNGDGASNIADAVGALGRLFGGGAPHVLGEDCAEFPGECESNCQ